MTYPSIICAVSAVITPSKPFLSLSADSKVVSIDTTALNLLNIGSNDFIYTVSFTNFPTAPTQSYNFKVVIKDINKLPCFSPKLVDSVQIQMTMVSESWSMSLPKILDLDVADVVTLKAVFGDAGNFLKLNG